MSIKNQSRFTIFASLIVGVTILAFVALNLIVDKISKISHSQVAQQAPGKGPRPVGFSGQGNEPDDVYKEGANPNGVAPGQMPNAGMPSKAGSPDMQGAPGAMRRMNNGKNGAEFEQKPVAPSNAPRPSTPTQQQDMRQGAPAGYPDPSKMSPEERDAFEREMFRRQQMMQPDYDYPPPEYYQNPYERYEDDYDYDPGYRGQKTDAKSSPVKISDSSRAPDYNEEDDEEYDPDDYLEDDLE